MFKNKLLLFFLAALIPGCSCSLSKQQLERAIMVCEKNDGVELLTTDAGTGNGAVARCGNGARIFFG